MKAIWQRDFFRIEFEEFDKYAGKTLIIEGQNGLNKDFYILPKPEISWKNDETNKYENVPQNEYDEILAYILDRMKDTEYSIIVYNR